ncbi:WD repeat and SOCS box-containing protein 1 [Strongylocentrotus purpuratus]|uniref:SOCS box domain-containing protein n=1 Tax=Strongylocentrotus purpuratus TaxID=7668 RepID=A0A7M7GHJ5_STRPU|nr:WD repeat and SOCS box-containing protein 1 [Strongylocentrotus purpuratus]|eukprot:XP_003727659.1 PREDICTED: WD repeat and SOCS box-containing protein 1 [Strongylocentrotus purpuratus]
MGTFQNTSLEDIAKASVITELEIPVQQREVLPSFHTTRSAPETWSVAFAPDQSYFAWSCGNRIVKLIPWDKEKQNIYNDRDNDQNNNADDPTVNNATSRRNIITIPCKDLVRSLTFGTSVPDKKSQRCSVSYRLFGFPEVLNNAVILAIGLKNGKIKTYNVNSGEHVLLVDHKSVVRDIKFNPDGSLFLVSASHDSTLKVWDMKDDGNMVVTLKGHPKAVYGCAISPDSSMLASVGEQRSVIVWDFTRYKLLRKLQGHHNMVTSCEFSADGAVLATASYDTRVILWDPYTGHLLSQFSHVFPVLSPMFAGGSNGHYVRDISFSPTGLHFATVCDDSVLRVWSISNNMKPILVSSVQEPLSCAFNHDGTVLAAGTRSGSVQFVAVHQELQTLKHLCRMTLRRCYPNWNELEAPNIPIVLDRYIGYRDVPIDVFSEDH